MKYRIVKIGDRFFPQSKGILWGWNNIEIGLWDANYSGIEDAERCIERDYKSLMSTQVVVKEITK